MVASIANSSFVGRARGAATQTRILEKAVHIASIEGLESMSLATLAKATSMSKSGLFAHFRSKEALQIAIIDEAERLFFDAVVRPAQAAPAGMERLTRLVEGYVHVCAGGLFSGGCFFSAAAHEFDGRPGPVRDRVVAYFDRWHAEVRKAAQEAMQRGELRDGLDLESFIFECQGIGMSSNVTSTLGGGGDRAREHGMEAIRALLERCSTAKN